MLRRPCALVLLATSLLTSPLPAQDVSGVLDTLQEVWPYSVPRGIATTPQGDWLFIGEGGSLAIIKTSAQEGFNSALRRVPIGDAGVVPVRMHLDPMAADPPLLGDEDLLYIAGGRAGLWVMQANVGPEAEANGASEPQHNRAERVDDSGNADPSKQNSTRWCCDVDTFELAGEEYLLALFQKYNPKKKQGASRLRVYRLSDARAVIHSELEIAPLLQVKLENNPFAPPPVLTSHSGSLAMAMSVDTTTVGSNAVADVYVAMGFHGLARVRIHAGQLTNSPPPGVPAEPEVQWGPVFGDGSHYNEPGNTAIPAGTTAEWYGNFEIMDLADDSHPTADILSRSEFPLFADVVVQNDAWGHYLYAAVDHLNWVRFRLDSAAEPWGPTMPIDHHEGQPVADQAWGELQLQAVPTTKDPISYTRAIALTQPDPQGTIEGPLLVISAASKMFHRDPAQFTEGLSFDTSFRWGGIDAFNDGTDRVVVYRIAQGFTDMDGDGYNMANWLEFGGRNLVLPPVQNNPQNRDAIRVFHNDGLHNASDFPGVPEHDATCMALVPVPEAYDSIPTGHEVILLRDLCDLAGKGRKLFGIGVSIVDPDLLLLGTNDGALPEDGFLVTGYDGDESLIKQYYEPEEECGDDHRGMGGLILNNDAQWFGPEPGTQYTWGEGRIKAVDGSGNHLRWKILKLDVGSDPFQTSPKELFRWFLDTPTDRFGSFSRRFIQGAGMSLAYDQHTRNAFGGAEMVFGTRHYPAVEGLIAMRRDVITDYLEGGGGTPKPSNSIHKLADIPGSSPVAFNTHPEFDNMFNGSTDARNYWQDRAPGSATAIFTWPPKLIQVDTAGTEDMNSWILAVPCGKIWASPDWQEFRDHPEWAPSQGSIWEQNFGHSLVQFWDVTNPLAIPMSSYASPLGHQVDNNSPLPKAIGPDAEGMAFEVDSAVVNGRTYAFVADFGGRLLVYDVRDILDQNGQPDAILEPFETWRAPLGNFDDLPNAVFSVEIDKINDNQVYVYVAVRRIGIQVLRFNPGKAQGKRLKGVTRIQTADDPMSMTLRVDGAGVKSLVVADYIGGVRIFKD